MQIITTEIALKLIKSTQGQIFNVTFTKKDGSIRSMSCRLGVAKHLKGGELAYDPKEYDLLAVFDVQKKGYRMINLETLERIAISGKEFKVV